MNVSVYPSLPPARRWQRVATLWGVTWLRRAGPSKYSVDNTPDCLPGKSGPRRLIRAPVSGFFQRNAFNIDPHKSLAARRFDLKHPSFRPSLYQEAFSPLLPRENIVRRQCDSSRPEALLNKTTSTTYSRSTSRPRRIGIIGAPAKGLYISSGMTRGSLMRDMVRMWSLSKGSLQLPQSVHLA